MNYAVIDTETTGLDGKVIQFAANNKDWVTSYSFWYNPNIPIEYEASAVHGVSNSDLKNLDTVDVDYAKGIVIDIVNGNYVIGHNIQFDIDAIERTFNLDLSDTKTICTMEMANYLKLKDVVGSVSNMALYYYFLEKNGDDNELFGNAHNASFDIAVTEYIFLSMFKMMNVNSLDELYDKLNDFVPLCMFPKHSGKTWQEVVSKDSSYVVWLLDSDKIKCLKTKALLDKLLK